METNHKNRVWLITGANSGFGKAFVEFLHQQGERVAATSRRKDGLDFLPDDDRVLKLYFDMREPAAFHPAVEQITDRWGRLDVLVNNAGYGLAGVLEELTEQQMRDQMETNVMGLFLLTQAVLPVMRKQGSGYIVNVASIAGLRGFRGMSLYSASKFAVVGFSESLAQELAPAGIHVSIVEPGPYRTDWAGRSLVKSEAMDSAKGDSPYAPINSALDQLFSQVSGRQPGDPMQVVRAVWEAASMDEPPVHMLFGDEAIQNWNDKLKRCEATPFFATYPHGTVEARPMNRDQG